MIPKKPRFVHFISTVIVVNMILLGIEVDLAASIGQARMVMMIDFFGGFERSSLINLPSLKLTVRP